MQPLPMVPASCSLEESELTEQLSRYRRLGEQATIGLGVRRIVVRLRRDASEELVTELIATEQRCCPFFQFTREGNRIEIAVTRAADEPALALLGDALTSGRARAGG